MENKKKAKLKGNKSNSLYRTIALKHTLKTNVKFNWKPQKLVMQGQAQTTEELKQKLFSSHL